MHPALASEDRSLRCNVLLGCYPGVNHPPGETRVEASCHRILPHRVSANESPYFELCFSLGFMRAHDADLEIA